MFYFFSKPFDVIGLIAVLNPYKYNPAYLSQQFDKPSTLKNLKSVHREKSENFLDAAG